MTAATFRLGRTLARVEQLEGGWRALVEARAVWRRLDTLFNLPTTEARTALPAPEGRLGAEAVVFGVRGATKPIIRGASFSISAGEALGIVGPSASGKSTLARLLVGILRPSSGSVRLDGADISTWPRESLGRYMGYLPQDVELFPGTVTQNIARLEAPDAAGVIRAAQRAHVHDMILRLPQGYDTELGDAAGAPFPGQPQRIPPARAPYWQPPPRGLGEPHP